MRSSLAILWATAAAAIAAPSLQRYESPYAVKDRHPVPVNWVQLGRAPADHVINLRIGLKQKSFAELERHLYEVSDPTHERYGQHLSNDEVHALVAPDDEALTSVHSWLDANDVPLHAISYSPAKDWVVVALPVEQVEALLDTEYHVYTNDEGFTAVRTPQYSLPLSLHEHIDVVQPTNYFGNPRALAAPFRMSSQQPTPGFIPDVPAGDLADIGKVCNASAVTNRCLRAFYGTSDYTPQVPGVNSVAMTAFLNQTANISDFRIFFAQQRAHADQSYLFNYTVIAGGADDQKHVNKKQLAEFLDAEANLDSQTIGGIVYPTDFRVYSTGTEPPFIPDTNTPTDTNEPYLTWLDYMLTLESPPHTISTSYDDDEQTWPYPLAVRVCQDLAQLGAKGVTLFFAAGDSGVGANGTCISNNGTDAETFIAAFPSTCPYVTSVGATRNFNPEIVAYDTINGYVSGSGLSRYFPRPAYQDAVLPAYLASIDYKHSKYYNASGRGYPDIAAQGYHYIITYLGIDVGVDGTSCATPCAAGVLTLVNDALIAAGKSPLGFFNPALYGGLYKAFNDITIGNTYGCNTSGFPAQEGWDLASGWGTPNFSQLTSLLLSATTTAPPYQTTPPVYQTTPTAYPTA